MRRHFAFLFRDSMVYGLATALNRLVKIILVPIIAKSYSTDVYGAFDALSVYLYVGAALAILGLNSSVIIVATGGGRATSADGLRGPAATCFRVVLGAGVAIAVVVALAAPQFSVLLLGSSRHSEAVIWAAASIPFSAVLLYALSVLQWSLRKAWYVGIAFGAAVLTIGFTYIAAVHTRSGLVGFFVANLIGQALGAIAAVYAARDLIMVRWQRETLRHLFVIGLPFAIISVAGGLLPSIGRFFLVQFHSLADAGIYGLGQKIATLSVLILAGFQAAWAPFAFARRADPEANRLFATTLLLIATLVAYLSVMLALAAPWISRVVATSEYAEAPIFVGPLSLAAGLSAVFAVVAIGSVLEGRSLHNLVAYIIGLGVTLGANALLAMTHAPAIGIAWASVLGQLAAVVLMAVLSQRVHPVPFPFGRSALILVGAAAIITVVGGRIARMETSVIAGLAGAVTLGSAVWLWRVVLTPDQRAGVRAWATDRHRRRGESV